MTSTRYWKEIVEAPINSFVEVCSIHDAEIEFGPFVMKYDLSCENPIVGSHSGMWVNKDNSFTWDSSRGHGPTHFREI